MRKKYFDTEINKYYFSIEDQDKLPNRRQWTALSVSCPCLVFIRTTQGCSGSRCPCSPSSATGVHSVGFIQSKFIQSISTGQLFSKPKKRPEANSDHEFVLIRSV